MVPHALALSITRQAEAVLALEKVGLVWEAGAMVRALLETDFLLGWLLEDDGSRDVFQRTRLWMIHGIDKQLELGDSAGQISDERRKDLEDYRRWLFGELVSSKDDLEDHLELLHQAIHDHQSRIKERAKESENPARLYAEVNALRQELAAVSRERRSAAQTSTDDQVASWHPNVRTLAGPERRAEYESAYRLGSRLVHPSMHTVTQLARPIDGGGWTLTDPDNRTLPFVLEDAHKILRAALARVVAFEESRGGDSPIRKLDLDQQ